MNLEVNQINKKKLLDVNMQKDYVNIKITFVSKNYLDNNLLHLHGANQYSCIVCLFFMMKIIS